MVSKTIKGLTVEIGGDTTKLGKALEDVEKKSRDLSSELGEINKLLKMDPGNIDLLAQKQKVLADAVGNTKEKLETLKEAEKQVQAQFERGDASEEQVRALQREIVATAKKLEGYEQAAKETAEAVDKLGKESEDLEDDIKDTEKGADNTADALDKMEKETKDVDNASSGLGSTLGGALKTGLTGLVAVVGAVGTGLVASAEATREYRTEMGKLNTAFTDAGHSSEAAKETYQALQGVLGETDQAVEAANHLAKLADSEKDLQTWTDIATGVYATFGASLPIEGLTEAANETAKTGTLTGSLADALNWAGVNEEKFQAQLDACSTEQERQALITDTLNGLYSDAAEQYKETNAEIIRANEANEAWTASMAEVGGAIEPILTDVKMLGASLLSELVPGVKDLAEAFRGILNGDDGAAEALGASLSGIISQLVDKVTELVPTVATVAMSLIQTLTSTLLESMPTILQTIIGIATQIINSLASYLTDLLPDIAKAWLNIQEILIESIPQILDAIMTVVDGVVDSLPDLLQTLVDYILMFTDELIYEIFPKLIEMITVQLPILITTIVNMLVQFMPTLLSAAVTLFSAIVQAIPQIITALVPLIPTIVTTLINGLIALIPQLLEGALTLLRAIVDAIPLIIEALVPEIPNIINTIINGLLEALPLLLDAAITLLFAIIDAIPTIIDALIEALPTIINAILDGVLGALPQLLEAAVTLLLAIVEAIPKFIPILVEKLPQIISTIVQTLLQNLPKIIEGAVQLFMGLIQAIPQIIVELVKNIPQIITAIVNGLGEGVKSIASVGKDLIMGLWNGISDMVGWITDKIKGFGESILGGIKSFFGIKSPSRVFRDQIGKMLVEGMAEGIEENADAPLDAMTDLSDDLLNEAGSLNGLTLERQLNNTFASQPSAAETNLLGKLDSILAAIEAGQVLVLDGDAVVGGTADRMNAKLGQIQILTTRGAI